MTARVPLVVLFLLLLTSCGAPREVDPEPTAQAGAAPCAGAWAALQVGLLAEAEKRYLDLLKAAPDARECGSAGVVAVAEQRGRATRLAAEGDRALAAGDYATARDRYRAALAADTANAKAATGLRTVAARGDRVIDDPAGRVDDRTGAWSDLLLQVLLAIVVAMLTLAAVGRFVAARIGPTTVTREPRGWIYGVFTGGVLLALVSTAALAMALMLPWSRAFVALGVAVGVGLVAAILFGIGYGHRLKLRLEVRNAKNETDNAATAYLLSRLTSLGNEGPQNLRRPVGTDVTSLDTSAVAALPVNKILQAVLRTAQALLPTKPWQVQVTTVDKQTVTVEIARNGRPAEPILVDRQSLETDLGETDESTCRRELLTAAAAAILLQMAKAHPSLQRGLCGATEWRSVACQVLAGERPYRDDPARAGEMLARAVEDDRRNLAAQLAYIHARAGRWIGSYAVERRRAQRLDRLAGVADLDLPGNEALQLRVLYSRTAAWVNTAALAGTDAGKHTEQAREALAALKVRLAEALDRKKASPKLRTFAREMEPVAALLDHHLDGTELPALDALSSLTTLYTRAGVDPDGALEHLELALGMGRYRSYARVEPWFTGIRGQEWFRRLVLADGTLAGFRTIGRHATTLAELGIRYPRQLAAETETKRLAEALKVDERAVLWWRDLCDLAGLAEDDDAPGWVDLLVAEGIATREELAAQDATSLWERLVSRGAETGVPAPDRPAVEAWINRAKAPRQAATSTP